MRPPRSLALPLLLPVLLAALALVGLLAGARAASAAPPAVPLAASLYVSPSGTGVGCSTLVPCTLQTAVAVANTGDTIIVRHGTYTGTGAAVITVSKSITLLGGWNGSIFPPLTLNPTSSPSVLDGQNVRRVIGNVAPTIDGFTIANGNATGQTLDCTSSSAKGCGGGIFVVTAAARLYNIFISNTALAAAASYGQGAGGGLYLQNATGSVISGNTFISNVASLVYQGLGGGLSIEGGLGVTVRNNTFQGNSADPWGGGLALGGDTVAVVSHNTFTGNSSAQGAGLYTWFAAATINNNDFTNNAGDSTVYLGYASGQFEANRVIDNPSAETGVQVTNGYPGERVTLVNNMVVNSGPDALSASGYNLGPLHVDGLHNTLLGVGNGVHVTSGHVTMTLTNTLIAGVVTGIRRDFPLSGTVKSNRTLFDTGVISHGTATEVSSLTGAALASATGNIPAASAANGTGLPTPITVDFQGDPRPLGVGPEIGADEIYIRRLYLPLATR